MTAEQQSDFRKIAQQRLSEFQQIELERAEKLWNLLSLGQQAELPELVRKQGPTSAALAIGWGLGFDLDTLVPGYPMLGQAPVRKRLGITTAQKQQLDAITQASMDRRSKDLQARQAGESTPAEATAAAEANENEQVETVLTPAQLKMVNEFDFQRKVVLALADPANRAAIGMTPEQAENLKQLDQGMHVRKYETDRVMLPRALETLTPKQRQELKAEIDQRFYGHASN